MRDLEADNRRLRAIIGTQDFPQKSPNTSVHYATSVKKAAHNQSMDVKQISSQLDSSLCSAGPKDSHNTTSISVKASFPPNSGHRVSKLRCHHSMLLFLEGSFERQCEGKESSKDSELCISAKEVST